MPEVWTASEARLIGRYVTNIDRPVFALRDLPEVVKGTLLSRYSRSERSLRRILLDEFLAQGIGGSFAEEESPSAGQIDSASAEQFYERVLVGYGDDSVAELAGAHLATEDISLLAAKALEDSRIGLSPLEKSTRYVRFDNPAADGEFRFYRGAETAHPKYTSAARALFLAYAELLPNVTERLRERHPRDEAETQRAWLSATRAKALDLIRGLLPTATLTNVGLYGNGRAFEYLITKLLASPLPECQRLAGEIHRELSQIIPAFVRRSMDARGLSSARRMAETGQALSSIAPLRVFGEEAPTVKLLEFDQRAEEKVVAACLFPYSNLPLAELSERIADPEAVLDAALGKRENRRDRAPRALEQAYYTFEIVANFGAYRDLQRHRMLSQDRQVLGTDLGYDVPSYLDQLGMGDRFREAIDASREAHQRIGADLGPNLAQYVVPLAFRVRWYIKANLRELFYLCELRTTPQGHADYRYVAQEMYRKVQEVHPLLARYARFVNLESSVDDLERRASERRLDEKLKELNK